MDNGTIKRITGLAPLSFLKGLKMKPGRKGLNLLTVKEIDHMKDLEGKERSTLRDGGGLYVEKMKATGRKSFRLIYIYQGQKRVITLGEYPYLTLDQARQKRAKIKAILEQGLDPAVELAPPAPPQKEAIPEGERFETIMEQWFEAMRPVWSENHYKDYRQKATCYVLPFLGVLSIHQIDQTAVGQVIEGLRELGKYQTLKKVRIIISAVIKFAKLHGFSHLIDPTPVFTGLAYSGPKPKHRARLTRKDDIAGLMKDITAYCSVSPLVGLAMRFSAFTFARPGEVRRAEWSEIDWLDRLWRIPAEKMKARVEHLVPLADQTLEVLNKLKPLSSYSRYIFPSPRTKTGYLSEAAVLAALRRLAYTADQMCPHGFRAIASTILNEHGFQKDWVECQLAHAERNAVRAAYNETDFLSSRKKMMAWWADYLCALETGAELPKGPIVIWN